MRFTSPLLALASLAWVRRVGQVGQVARPQRVN